MAVVAAVAASALVVGVSAAGAAKGGNSANAKLCQKGGWQDLVGSQEQSFASEEECVSHAAQGGTLSPKPTPLERWEAICAGGGGFPTINAGVQWRCRALTVDALSQTTKNELDPVCTEAGGTPVSDPVPPDEYSLIACNFS